LALSKVGRGVQECHPQLSPKRGGKFHVNKFHVNKIGSLNCWVTWDDMSLNLRLSENKVYERIPTFDGWLAATISNFPIHMANVSRCFKGINPIFLLNTPSFRATLLQDEDEFLTSCCPHITWRQRVTGWLCCFCPVPSDLAPCPPSTCWCYGPVMVQLWSKV